MIIVSQNKNAIVNFDKIQLCRIRKEGIVYALLNEYDSFDLGKYKTEERAKEVLQEIISKYKQWNKDANNAVTIIPKVYEMPKE